MYHGVEGVYLIHFQSSLHHARHYIGWSSDIGARIALHQAGKSQVALTRAVSQQGIEMMAVRVWRNADRDFERALKNRKNAARLCPICNPQSWQKNGEVDELHSVSGLQE